MGCGPGIVRCVGAWHAGVTQRVDANGGQTGVRRALSEPGQRDLVRAAEPRQIGCHGKVGHIRVARPRPKTARIAPTWDQPWPAAHCAVSATIGSGSPIQGAANAGQSA